MSERLQVFPERPSLESEQYIAVFESLERPPGFELSEGQRQEVLAFEHSLSNTIRLDGLNVESLPLRNLPELIKAPTNRYQICIEYFLDPKNVDQLQILTEYAHDPELLGILRSLPIEKAREVIEQHLSEKALDRATKPKQWSSWKKASTRWASEQYQQILLGATDMHNPSLLSICNRPDRLTSHAQNVRDLKQYYKAVGKLVAKEDQSNPVVQAKQAVLELHRERLNQSIVETYKTGFVLLRQYERVADSVEKAALHDQLEQLSTLLPGLKVKQILDADVISSKTGDQVIAKRLSMLDKYINGVDKSTYRQVSEELMHLKMENDRVPSESSPNNKGLYADVSPETLNNSHVDAETMQHMMQLTLSEYGLLSSDSNSNFEEPATDGKWRIIVTDSVTQVFVNKEQKTVKIPSEFDRTLNQVTPAGALPLLDHEVRHIIQHENSAKINLELIQKTKGARSSAWAESGGVYWEAKSQKQLFEQERGVNLTYLAAMEARLRGGSLLDSMQAFMAARMQRFPDTKPEEAAKQAANQVLRMFPLGTEVVFGANRSEDELVFRPEESSYLADSQLLDYAEQLIYTMMIKPDQEWLFDVGGLGIKDIANLYKTNLLRREDMFVPDRLPSTIVEPYVRKELLHQAA